ncbi:hypothetical protein [Motilimonas eburnea]|uniref:hypothetical protein n=1 Tax=Motilimonas eburnea TaxID=1737488 RepID=UPI001E437F97|nr:hypothetical protein [Motilimonas eburnea]MCE2573245.1 hypothetical protein [Motilimonas eburnea]
MNEMIEGQASQLQQLLDDNNDISLMIYLEGKNFSHMQQRHIVEQLKHINNPTFDDLAGLLDQNLI